MNTFEQESIVSETNQKIELTTDSIHSLDTIWRWASFFSILGFIGIAFMILMGLVMGFVFSALDNGLMGAGFKYIFMFIYIILGAVYFYPILLLFRFSNWTKKAIRNNSSLDLSVALKNLKGHFQYIGIMTIVLFALYFIVIIGVVLFKAFV
ncbi:MAG TPA: hypothetical protein DIW31_10755 [Bacteroidales bacterium]|nr:hypothetical protein [Bacteroidales bacterium]